MCLQWQQHVCIFPVFVFFIFILYLTGWSALRRISWSPRNAWITRNKRRACESIFMFIISFSCIFICWNFQVCFCLSMFMQITLQRTLFLYVSYRVHLEKEAKQEYLETWYGFRSILRFIHTVQLHQTFICSRLNLLCFGWFSLKKKKIIESCNSGLLFWNLNLSYGCACIAHFKILRKVLQYFDDIFFQLTTLKNLLSTENVQKL